MSEQEQRSATTQRVAQAGVEGWQVLLPRTWVTFPTAEPEARQVIGRTLDRVLEGKPRDEMVQVRIELDRALRRQVAEAAKAGAAHVHALMEPVRGVPVSASLIMVPVPSGDPEEIASALGALFGASDGVVESGHLDLGEKPSIYRVRREPIELGEGNDERSTHLATYADFVVPLDDASVLVLVFSTVTEPVADELVTLFMAIAGTLHRAPAAG